MCCAEGGRGPPAALLMYCSATGKSAPRFKMAWGRAAGGQGTRRTKRNYKFIFDDRFKTRKKTNRFGFVFRGARTGQSTEGEKKCKQDNKRWAMDSQT